MNMTEPKSQLTHLDDAGHAAMVDVGNKSDTQREAVATGHIRMAPATLEAILAGNLPKGDVFATARIAGIQAAKRCAELIPLCHLLLLSSVAVDMQPDHDLPGVVVTATCKVTGKTGVEMEALTAVSVALLTIYDMAKAIDKAMRIEGIRLLEKRGGRSEHWQA